jgi:hypothetical protein
MMRAVTLQDRVPPSIGKRGGDTYMPERHTEFFGPVFERYQMDKVTLFTVTGAFVPFKMPVSIFISIDELRFTPRDELNDFYLGHMIELAQSGTLSVTEG